MSVRTWKLQRAQRVLLKMSGASRGLWMGGDVRSGGEQADGMVAVCGGLCGRSPRGEGGKTRLGTARAASMPVSTVRVHTIKNRGSRNSLASLCAGRTPPLQRKVRPGPNLEPPYCVDRAGDKPSSPLSRAPPSFDTTLF